MRKLVTMWSCLILLAACKSDDGGNVAELSYEDQLAIDTQILDDYLAERNIEAEIHDSGLRYVITNPGDGERPQGGGRVIVAYEGRFLDGTVFDRSGGIERALGGFIPGWQIGIPLIKSGGSITLYIPSGLAYGSSGTSNGAIPGNTNLIFDTTLLGVR